MAPKSDPQIGVSVDTGDRVVGAGAKDADGKYRVPLVDNDGHVQVDVLSGAGAGTQYADGAARGTATGTLAMGDDGTNIQSVKVDSSGELQVDVLSITAGDNNIGNVDVVTMPGVVGTVADDGTTPGNPVMIGGKAVETDGTTPSSVSAEDDVAICRTDRMRRLLVSNVHPFLWRVNENQATAQTNNALKAAPGSNLSLYVTDIIISNGATAGTVSIVEDTGGTPATLLGPYYLAINGGMSKKFATPVRVTTDKDVGFTSVTVTTHTVSLLGYTAP